MLREKLSEYIDGLKKEFNEIPESRKEDLQALASVLQVLRANNRPVPVLFVCTHNSRRSQVAELWLRTLLGARGITYIDAFSGGTEVTAFNPRMVAALARIGFLVNKDSNGSNPHYRISGFEGGDGQKDMFSKVYRDDFNPKAGFIAVMVCSEADEACPIVFGARHRFSLPYDDPKEYDDSDQEQTAYDHTVRLIGRDIAYMVSLL